MADLGGEFNAATVDPLGEYTPLPAGDYRCVVTKSDWKPTKSGNGRYLEFGFQVLAGEHQGRTVFSRLNLENPNQQAVSIARSELSSMCRAVGVMTPRDTSELHDVPLIVKVALKKRDDNGEFTNEIKGYASVRDHAEKKPQPEAASAGSAKPNWM